MDLLGLGQTWGIYTNSELEFKISSFWMLEGCTSMRGQMYTHIYTLKHLQDNVNYLCTRKWKSHSSASWTVQFKIIQ